jgi:hypothetical protein
MLRRMRFLAGFAGILGVLLTAAPAAAPPGNPNNPGDFINNPHPAMPWAFYNPNVGGWDYGDVVQYMLVPSQQVVIQVPAPLPDGVPPQAREETVEIPGYYVAETTTGYWYPERWALQQLSTGVYQWVQLPAEFQRKAIVERRPPAILR